jgi:flagellar biosynthesis protein FlhB
MAENEDGASRTEAPTPRKLQQAREKGDVPKTQDLPALASLLGAVSVMVAMGGAMSRDLAAALQPFLAHAGTMSLSGSESIVLGRRAVEAGAPVVLAVLGAAAAGGVVANLVQGGFMLTPSKLAPDFKKISPLGGFKRLFGVDSLVQFVKSVAKVAMVGFVAWWVLRPSIAQLSMLPSLPPVAMMPLLAEILKRLIFAVVAISGVIAGADWLWQRHRFMERMKMTKEEVKEDHKQSDGDPHIKAKRRQMQMERSRRRMMQAVPSATVVVMNPTHYAVALKYEQGGDTAPTCVAKGLDALALKIRDVAKAAGVAVIEDPPLARALYAAVDIDETIPPAHFEAVAKIIGFILSAGRGSARKS